MPRRWSCRAHHELRRCNVSSAVIPGHGRVSEFQLMVLYPAGVTDNSATGGNNLQPVLRTGLPRAGVNLPPAFFFAKNDFCARIEYNEKGVYYNKSKANAKAGRDAGQGASGGRNYIRDRRT